MMTKTNSILIYDYERDKDLQPGQAILVFENGFTRRVRESSLFEKEAPIARRPIYRKASSIRGRTSGITKHRTKHTKRHAVGKRIAIYQA